MQDPSRTLTRPGVVIEATEANATSDPLPWVYHGVVKGHWKYVERTTGRKELYDLTTDPFELSNVAGKAAYAQTQVSWPCYWRRSSGARAPSAAELLARFGRPRSPARVWNCSEGAAHRAPRD